MDKPKRAERLQQMNIGSSLPTGDPPARAFEQFTPQDAAHAVALIRGKGAQLLARVHYAQQPEFYDDLLVETTLAIWELVAERRWKIREPVTVRGAAKLAIMENIAGKRFSGRRRATIMGIDARTYSRVWHRRLEDEIGPMVERWDSEIEAGCRRAMSNR